MSDFLFLVEPDGSVQQLDLAPYQKEDDLQELLARNPEILKAIAEREETFLLVSREVGVPDGEGRGNRWSIDHLFVDSKGVPTLVETKRSSDTRLRREIVGQMLDYAANGLIYWAPGEIRKILERRCESEQIDADDRISQFVGNATGDVAEVANEFWERVEANRKAEQLRLVFVSDHIPAELQRVIEYLNDQMRGTEVLGLELRQFLSEGKRTLLPRVVGRTAKAQQQKAVDRGGSREEWEEERFMGTLEANAGAEACRVAAEILRWSESRQLRIDWSGSDVGTFTPILDWGDWGHRFVKVAVQGEVRTQLSLERRRKPFDDVEARREMLLHLNSIPGVNLPEAAIDGKRYGFPLTTLADPESLRRFFEVFDWFIARVRQAA